MIDYTSSLWIFAATLIALFVVVPSKLELTKRVVLMATLLVCGTLAYRSINARAGLPTTIPAIDEEALVISFFVDKDMDKIYVWIKLDDSNLPKTFAVKYNEETDKMLEALRGKYAGKPFYARVNSKKATKNGIPRLDEADFWLEIDDSVKLPEKDLP